MLIVRKNKTKQTQTKKKPKNKAKSVAVENYRREAREGRGRVYITERTLGLAR